MKILWSVNILPPEIEEKLGLPHYVGGSWLIGLRNALRAQNTDILLCIVGCYYGHTEIRHTVEENIEYYAVPMDQMSLGFEKILEDFKPDIVHLHGTESVNAYKMAQLVPQEKLVTSIQGLMCECSAHYFDGIPKHYKKLSPLKQKLASRVGNVLMQCQHQMFVNGIAPEEDILRKSGSIIGRTKWDRACSLAINPTAKYYSCNEILRDCFYTGEWSYDKCIPHTLYISQAHYPIKGAHMLLKALGKVKKQFPDLKLYIGGHPPSVYTTRLRRLAGIYLEEYRSYLKMLSIRYGLVNHIFYIGPLSETEVKHQLLNTNVFVSPSSIENESNALSEAKMLGLPSIVSAVGGVQDRIEHGVDGFLYDFYDTDTLAAYISELFSCPDKCRNFSVSARKSARLVNDILTNVQTIISVYEDVYARSQK